MPRLLKQVIIAFVFFLIIGSITYFYSIKDFPEPTPAPLIFQTLKVISEHLFKVGDLDYDFLIEIKNPNTEFGATDVFYELNLFDRASELITVKRGAINFLPGQTRYEIISPIIVDREISNAEFKIISVSWQKLKEYIPQSLFSVKNQEYSQVKLPEQGFSKLIGTLANNSNFDFDRVDIYIVLFNELNSPIAVQRTDIRTFLAKTDRFFEVKWSKSFNGRVIRIETDAYTNVFKNENFIKEYGTQEKFQKFY